MYHYKINNSYTIYVCTEYIHDCIQESKKITKYTKKATQKAKLIRKPVTLPSINTFVSHKKWGEGKIIETNIQGIITVAFSDCKINFLYPDAFKQGHLVRI